VGAGVVSEGVVPVVAVVVVGVAVVPVVPGLAVELAGAPDVEEPVVDDGEDGEAGVGHSL